MGKWGQALHLTRPIRADAIICSCMNKDIEIELNVALKWFEAITTKRYVHGKALVHKLSHRDLFREDSSQ
jgi:hypothetical protein